MKYVFVVLIALATVFATGCTDTAMAHWESVGDPAHITCYSGGKVYYDGHSTGKVQTTHNSDGWEFMDATDRKLVRVSGQCVVRQD